MARARNECMHEEELEDGGLKKGLPEIDLVIVGGVSNLRHRIDYASRISYVVDMERDGMRDVTCNFDATTANNSLAEMTKPTTIATSILSFHSQTHPRRPYPPPHVHTIFS
jgi:hypothetical protein